MWTCHFLVTIGPKIVDFFPQIRNFSKKPNFHFPSRPFHCAKLKKKSLEWNQSYKYASFSRPKWPNCPNKNFFGKPDSVIFMYFVAPLIAQNFKKNLGQMQSYQGATFSGQN